MFIQLGDFTAHCVAEGPSAGPPLLLLHSLGTDLHMWEPQVSALARHHRVIRMDMRGHGLSGVTPAPYSMETLARDALALLDALGVARAHVAGVSIGGRIAQAMAVLAPERVASLMLCDTALEFGPPERWEGRIAAVRAGGMAAVADEVMARWVVDTGAPAALGLRRMLLSTDPEGYAGCGMALRDCRADEVAGRITCPTTVVVGDRDTSTTPEAAAAIHAAVPGSRLVVIADAAHIPNYEQEAPFTAALETHLAAAAGFPTGPEGGMAVRRAVLGAAHVDRSEAALTPLDQPFREFILEGVWGRVWTRPGLARRDRSLLCLGIMAALGHEEEFALHVRATRNTGVTEAEIAEVIVQVGAYAGVPYANRALRVAKAVLKEMRGA